MVKLIPAAFAEDISYANHRINSLKDRGWNSCRVSVHKDSLEEVSDIIRERGCRITGSRETSYGEIQLTLEVVKPW